MGREQGDASAGHAEYARYLQGRSKLALVYRSFLLYPLIRRHLRGRVLDVGCGIGDFVWHRPNTIGIDVNPETIAVCRSRGLAAEALHGDRYPFEDASFDGVVLDNVLEHIVEPAPVVREIRRVLRPGGRVVVGVPGAKGFASDADHKRFYTDRDVRALFADFVHRHTFAVPLIRSEWLSRHLRQYAVYVVLAAH